MELKKIIADGLPSSVSEFFTPAEYAKISDLEKKRLMNLRLNYEALRSAGFPVTPPEFMSRKIMQKKKQDHKVKSLNQPKKQERTTDVQSKVSRVLRQTPSRLQQKMCAENINEKKAKRLPPHSKKLQMVTKETFVAGSYNHEQKTGISDTNVHHEMGNVQHNSIYSCHLCYLSFSIFGYLRRHMRSKHGPEYLEFLQHNACLDTTYKHSRKKETETLHRPGDCRVTRLSIEKAESQPRGDNILPDYGDCLKTRNFVPGNRNVSRLTRENKHGNLGLGNQLKSSENVDEFIGEESDWKNCDNLKANLKTHSDKTPYNCDVCGFTCLSMSRMERHGMEHAGERPYKCHICSLSFTQSYHLKVHYRKHTGERPYKCHLCAVSFSLSSALQTHYRKHTVERPYKCHVCAVSFSQSSALQTHYRKHTGERPYKCHVCAVSFSQSSALQRHYRKHTGERPYKCHVCSLSFAQSYHLKVHYRKHTGERPYKCHVCAVSFSQSSALQTHYRKHTGERPYKCVVCAMSFPQSSALQTHYRKHTGERPYKCHVCSLTFSQSSNLKVHHRQHTGERPYKCHVCAMSFFRQSHLQKHKRQHTRDRP